MSDTKAPRIYRAGEMATPETLVPLDDDAAHHLLAVLRKQKGAPIRLFNEASGEWLAELEPDGKRRAAARLVRQLRRPEPQSGPLLAFSPVKKQRLDLVIEKAVELGVSQLVPVITERCENRRLNTDRLAAQVRGAAEQCERLSLPDVAAETGLAAFLAAWKGDRPLIVLDETGAGEPLATLAGRLGPVEVGFLLGPEGGFTLGELEILASQAFVLRAGLGPRILRAETAAIAALSI
ncbi:MAG: 16S rRNA (uracil(1498)-N(3))-methyltransferase, partial [Rhodospirillales bacterium]